MNWISIVFFAIALLLGATLFRKGADLLSPGRIFGFTWSIVLALSNLKLSRLQFDWSLLQWLFVLLGPLTFLLGIFVTYMMNLGLPSVTVGEMRRIARYENINTKILFHLIMTAFFLYIGGYFVTFLVKGYVPIFTFQPGAARIDYYLFGIGLLTHNMPIIVFFSVVYHLFTQENRKKKRVLKIVSGVTVITYFFLLQRFQLIMTAIMIFTILYYYTRYIRFRMMFLFFLAGVVLIYSVATIRSGKIIQLALYMTSEMKFSSKFAFITEPYMYVVMNVENFVHAMSKLEYFSYGSFTFDWFFALIQLKYPMKEYFGFVENPFLFSGYNTYTFFWTLYRDFGIIGISLIPAVCGFVVGSLYYAMRSNPTLERIVFYSIAVFVMVMSFFVNPLGFLWFIYIIAWMILILKFVRVKDSFSTL